MNGIYSANFMRRDATRRVFDHGKPALKRGPAVEAPLTRLAICGSGKTGATAERPGRRWLMSDLGRFSIHTSRFWAVDFHWRRGKPFEHHGQDYRTRKDRSLKTVSDFGYDRYPKPGKYTACVKVVDVFGCDTSITVEVKI